MKRTVLWLTILMFILLVGCNKNENATDQNSDGSTNGAQSSEDSATDNKPTGEVTTTECVAMPGNIVHTETVYITATGDTVTHIQIITGADIKSEVQMESYKYWLPLKQEGYKNIKGVTFSADEAAGTWTIEADINEESLVALAENYADLSLAKKGDHLSKDLLIQYYQALQYTCEEK